MESVDNSNSEIALKDSKPQNEEQEAVAVISATAPVETKEGCLSSESSSPTTTESSSTSTIDSNDKHTAGGDDCTDSPAGDEKALVLTSHCGIGPCHPPWMQVFAKAKIFTLLICIHALVEGAIVSGFTSVVISSIEKRYRFSSTAASMIVAVFDMAVTISVIFISYFGHNGHKPRWLGIGLIIQGIGAFVFALPQFAFGRYSVGSDAKLQLETCNDPADMTASCDPANNFAYSLFIIGNILIGIGAAPLFTIGLSFIDDIVYPRYVSIHLGLFQACVVIGPAIGYGLGGAFLSIYVDPSVSTNLDQSDPGWVGAWWLCFVLSGIASILIAIPFLMYPRELYNTHKVTEARKKEMADEYTSKYGDSEEKKIVLQVKTFPIHMKKLLLNPSYMFVTFGISFLFLSLEGMVSFGPKYVESVFSIPASVASVIIGAIAIPSGGVGVIVGALIVFFTKVTGKKLPIVTWVICLITLAPPLGFFITCPNLNVAGIYADYANNSLTSTDDVLLSSCNFDCNCTSTFFEPVCGADGITYFSPCRGGCQKRMLDGVLPPDNFVFENCTCITTSSMMEDMTTNLTTATNGKCDQNCKLLGPWAFLLAVFVFFLFVIRVPATLTTLRAVADEQRSLALGVQSVLLRVFGAIPGPIIFGAIFDSGCVYWQFECGRRANCWVYNNDVLGVRAFAIAVAGIFGSTVLFILSWIFYPPITTCESVVTPLSQLCARGKGRDDSTTVDTVAGTNEGFELEPQSPTKVLSYID